MRKKLALLVFALSAVAAAGVFSPPLEAACRLHECLDGEIVLCCDQHCCLPILP